MKTVLFCFSIIAFLFVVILLIRRYKEKINRGDVSLLVDISTVLVGIATLIVSGISIHVMLSQEETQGLLVELQKREHQPIFSINYTVSKSPASEVHDVEDYVVENIGEQMLSPANISCKSFIKVDYSDVDAGAGETLSSIAVKRGTTVAKLCKLNNISTKTILRVGQILKYS